MKKSLIYTIGFALLSVVIVVLFFVVHNNTLKTYNKNLPYLSLGDNVKNKTTQGHLWFEEYMAGDESINFESDIASLFDESEELLNAAYEGGEYADWDFDENPPREILNILKKSKKYLTQFSDLAEKRRQMKAKMEEERAQSVELFADSIPEMPEVSEIAKKSPQVEEGANAGGEWDQKFDQAYNNLQRELDLLVEFVNQKVKSDVESLNKLRNIVLICMSLFFCLVSVVFYRIQKAAEVTLEENELKLNEEIERINKLNDFVEQISSGNYNVEIKLDMEQDQLASALFKMREVLHTNSIDDEQRSWVTSGLAKFADVLRLNDNSIEELSDKIISNLVKYLEANQGSIFILSDGENNKQLDLTASYAWSRKKYLKKSIELGEGLVGRCWQEAETIYLIDLPENYINITSGLGEATPTSILIVPMKIENEVYGIMEIASFKEFEKYQVEFIEKLAESIAATISSTKTNIRTAKLLEASNDMTEQLQAQEEEMRQNMEEMQATQEEMERVSTEKNSKISQLQETVEKLQIKAQH